MVSNSISRSSGEFSGSLDQRFPVSRFGVGLRVQCSSGTEGLVLEPLFLPSSPPQRGSLALGSSCVCSCDAHRKIKSAGGD